MNLYKKIMFVYVFIVLQSTVGLIASVSKEAPAAQTKIKFTTVEQLQQKSAMDISKMVDQNNSKL
jgi:hypothetical protein